MSYAHPECRRRESAATQRARAVGAWPPERLEYSSRCGWTGTHVHDGWFTGVGCCRPSARADLADARRYWALPEDERRGEKLPKSARCGPQRNAPETWTHWRPYEDTPATHAHRWDGIACRCGYIPPFPAARIENSTEERCADCNEE